MRPTALLITAALTLPAEALACGGFFCNNDFPVDQTGEHIVFGVDADAGEVTAHVQIKYQGSSDDFAWIVPVPEQPELGVSSDALFTVLDNLTKPQFYLTYDTNGTCDGWWGSDDVALEGASEDADADGGGVTVVAEEKVGPYETVTLQATDASLLLTWLQDRDYDLPSDLDPVLQPYIADGQYFVALRLAADKDTGDLVPLAMTYPGDAASIPIQLTSVAAAPDMRLVAYVLGGARAVPDNYLHVTINEAAIDWFDGGSNYEDVVSLAADEAGGHAFATDFSGSTSTFQGRFWNDATDLSSLRTLDDPIEWVDQLMMLGIPPSAELLQLLMDLIPFPQSLADQGVSAQNFYDCLWCYEEHVDRTGFDGDAATDALKAQVVEGLRAVEDLLDSHPHISRMTSSLDAIEMTVDPLFVFNEDLPQSMTNVHTATLEYDCGIGGNWSDARRTLTLPDGREVKLPSESWIQDNDTTEFELMSPLHSPAAILIEDYGAEGMGTPMFDYRPQAFEEASSFGQGGCGCATGGAPLGGLGALFATLLVARRRRG